MLVNESNSVQHFVYLTVNINGYINTFIIDLFLIAMHTFCWITLCILEGFNFW